MCSAYSISSFVLGIWNIGKTRPILLKSLRFSQERETNQFCIMWWAKIKVDTGCYRNIWPYTNLATSLLLIKCQDNFWLTSNKWLLPTLCCHNALPILTLESILFCTMVVQMSAFWSWKQEHYVLLIFIITMSSTCNNYWRNEWIVLKQ